MDLSERALSTPLMVQLLKAAITAKARKSNVHKAVKKTFADKYTSASQGIVYVWNDPMPDDGDDGESDEERHWRAIEYACKNYDVVADLSGVDTDTGKFFKQHGDTVEKSRFGEKYSKLKSASRIQFVVNKNAGSRLFGKLHSACQV